MCDCKGLLDDNQTPCEGCKYWRKDSRITDGRACGVTICKKAKRGDFKLCKECWDARAPPQSETGAPSSPRSSVSGRSTPVQTPMLQTPPRPQAPTDARMEAIMERMESMLGRMEGIMGLMVSQTQSAGFGAASQLQPPPGITTACAPPAPPGASHVAAIASASSVTAPGTAMAAPTGAMNAAPVYVATAPQAKATQTPQPKSPPAAMTVQAVQPTVQAAVIGVTAPPTAPPTINK